MSRRLALAPATADVTLISATTATFPPTSLGAVPSTWGSAARGFVPQLDLNLYADAASGALTSVKLYAGIRRSGAIAGVTFTAAASDICTKAAHGWQTGDGPVQLTNSGGALPAGLATLTDYYIIRIDADTFYLATSFANALAGTHVDITGAGTGTHTLTGTASCQLMYWNKAGDVAATLSLAAREGFSVRVDHNPRVEAYAVTWSGTASNPVKVTISAVEGA